MAIYSELEKSNDPYLEEFIEELQMGVMTINGEILSLQLRNIDRIIEISKKEAVAIHKDIEELTETKFCCGFAAKGFVIGIDAASKRYINYIRDRANRYKISGLPLEKALIDYPKKLSLDDQIKIIEKTVKNERKLSGLNKAKKPSKREYANKILAQITEGGFNESKNEMTQIYSAIINSM